MLQIRDQFNALVKRIRSYSKRDWTFEDYPLKTWKNPNAGDTSVAYGAGFVNWKFLAGHGETPEKAVQALRESLEHRRESKHAMPRPGAIAPLIVEFESGDNISKYEKICRDFLPKIFGLDFDDGFFSDVTMLEDFASLDLPEEGFRERTIDKILKKYHVDIDDIYDQPLWITLDKIAKSRSI